MSSKDVVNFAPKLFGAKILLPMYISSVKITFSSLCNYHVDSKKIRLGRFIVTNDSHIGQT